MKTLPYTSDEMQRIIIAVTGIPLDELEAMCNARKDGRFVVLPQDWDSADELFHIVKFPAWCGEDCQCEKPGGKLCQYDRDGDCAFKPYMSKVSVNSVCRALYTLRGLSITREAAESALQEAHTDET